MSEDRQDVHYLDVGGMRRRYVMYRPPKVVASDNRMPMIIMLDGRGGTPWTAMRSTQWNTTADREGMIMVYPEATRMDPAGPLHFLTNPQMWNAGVGASDAERTDVDDLTFLRQVIDDAGLHCHVDPTRIYMTGFSNGAAMTYRFALQFPEVLAAIAPVSGHLRVRDETLPKPVPLISFFGRCDPLSPFDGGAVDLPWGKHEVRPPAIRSIQTWAAWCGHLADDVMIEPEPGLQRYRYGRAGERNEIEFVAVDDLGHVWPGGHRLLPEALVGPSSNRISANDEIWSFFSRHRITDV